MKVQVYVLFQIKNAQCTRGNELALSHIFVAEVVRSRFPTLIKSSDGRSIITTFAIIFFT